MSCPLTVSANGTGVAVGATVLVGGMVVLTAGWLVRLGGWVAAGVEVGPGWLLHAANAPETTTAQTKYQPE